jgi:foldase protein PrsA
MFKKRKMVPLASLFLALILVLSLFVWMGRSGTSQSVVATYNGGEITRDEFEKQFNFQRKLLVPTYPDSDEAKREFLEEYILLRKIILPQAKSAGVKIDPSKINSLVQQYKDQVTQLVYQGDKNAFEAKLKEYHITDDDIRTLAEDDLYLQGYQDLKANELKPTDADLKKFYEDHPVNFTTADVYHVLVKSEEEAKKVKARLLAGEDFAKVAKEVSIDPSAKDNGGHLGNAPLSNYVPEFADAALKLPIGQLSDPVKTQYGYHIIKVMKRDIQPFEKMKQQVRTLYIDNQKKAVWDKIMAQAKEQAKIKIQL